MLEIATRQQSFGTNTPQDTGELLSRVDKICEVLELSSSRKQMRTIWAEIRKAQNKQPSVTMTWETFASLLQQLRERISEDLEDRVFYCVSANTVSKFYTRSSDQRQELEFKPADELFDPVILTRFPACMDDIEKACKCLVLMLYTACIFHLMRIVEIGVREVARLSGIVDPKPSWGAVLQKVEKIVLRTRFCEVEQSIQPHIPVLTDLLPRMQAIQHAWRNKVSHVEDKLIPIEGRIDVEVASEIMTAVQAFMRKLATDLPVVS